MTTGRTPHRMTLYPFAEVAENANNSIARGWMVFQQFNCAACGAKNTVLEENVFYTSGKCQDCHAITDISRDGCNFAMMGGGET